MDQILFAQTGILEALAVVSIAWNIGSSLITGSRRKKRERKQVGALREHYGDVAGRVPEIERFYDELTAFSKQGLELGRESASQDFISQALKLGQAEEEGIRSSGMARSGQEQEISLQRELGSREYANIQDLLGQQFEGELLSIGKSEETELQGIEDQLFAIESEILGKGGTVGLDNLLASGKIPQEMYDSLKGILDKLPFGGFG